MTRSQPYATQTDIFSLTTVSLATRYLTPASPDASTPPSISTLLFSPLIGHISTSYLSSLTPALSLGTRYEFNVYSYESDWTLGGEWKVGTIPKVDEAEKRGVLKGRASTTGVRKRFYHSTLCCPLRSSYPLADCFAI